MFLDNRLEKIFERVKLTQPVPLRIKLWNGRTHDLGPDPRVVVTVPSARSLRYLVSPNLMKLGEAYVEGHIKVDGSLRDIFEVGEQFARAASPGESGFTPMRRFLRHTRKKDKKAIQYHYDVSNDFYALFLDRNMVYSCAYFENEDDTLDRAQEQKLDHILTKLRLKPGERFLDVGCGWGALIFRAVEKYGASAVGITLSQNQYDYVREKIREKGLEGRCEVRLQDYRDVPERGGYDKIASVGMFEHVGLKNLPVYFRQLRNLLKDGGIVLNHGITSSDPDSRSVGLGAGEFIDRYVFPDGELPHLSLVIKEMAAAGLEVADVESLRRHYARTCGLWAQSLERARDRAVALAGERRYRIWSVYLQGCSYGFAQGWMNIYQVLACKAGSPAFNTLPMTRRYMYAAETERTRDEPRTEALTQA
ncbi:MAG: class I SAM-dependent methyltransferase [Pseudomonadota bacterium]|nr:MAG: SAM-dependent methyltransferase [Pseudomonadota bacterium]